MKTKNLWLKTLVMMLCLTLSLTCLFACVGEEELAEVSNKADSVKTEVDKLETKLNDVAKNAAAIEELKTAVKGLTDGDTALEEKIAAVETAIANAEKAATDADAELKNELNDAINDVKTTLENKISGDLEALKNDLQGAINDLDTAIKGAMADLQAELEKAIADVQTALETAIADKADKTELALKADKAELEKLAGELATVSANWNAYNEATAELYEGEFSFDAFEDIWTAVDKNNYAEEGYTDSEGVYQLGYNDFLKEVEKLEFFLTRAVSVEQIKGYFADLQALIDDMPTLTETLAGLLATTTTVTAEKDFLDNIKAIEAKIPDTDATYTEELKTAFAALVAAHDNLIAAAEAAVALDAEIDAITTPIVWENSKTVLEAATKNLGAFKTQFFANPDYNKYYAEGENEYAKVVTGSADLDAYNARYNELGLAAADTNISKIFDAAVLNFDTVRPLWSQLAAVDANGTRFTEWLTKYNIDLEDDAVTLANIFTNGEVELYTKSKAYVDAMNEIYTTIDVDTLKANINALTTPALYSENAAWTAIHNTMVALKAAIEAVENFDAALDTNYAQMITTACQTKLDAVDVRMNVLVEAKAKIDEVYANMAAILTKEGGITYADKDAIDFYKAQLDMFVEYYAIEADNAEDETDNYSTICAAAYAKYDELIEAYKVKTADVLALYKEVRAYLDSVAWALKDGNEIQALADKLQGFVAMGVTDIDLYLEDDDEQATAIDFEQLLLDYNEKAAEYTVYAKDAEAAATIVNALVAALNTDGLKPTFIKNKARFEEAWAAVEAWCETWLTEADLTAAGGDVAKAVAAVQAVKIFGEDKMFAFVTTANYNNAKKWAESAVKTYGEAEETWAAIKADMEALIADWNVHSFSDKSVIPNFTEVMAAYEAYATEYYAASDVVDVLGEKATYDAFKTEYDACKALEASREGVANQIIAQIKALGEVTPDTAATVLAAIATINDAIAAYEAQYCDDGCLFGDNLFNLYRTTKLAEFAKACKDAYAYADDAVKIEKVNNAWNSGRQWIESATDESFVDFAYGFATSTLEGVIEEINPAPAA